MPALPRHRRDEWEGIKARGLLRFVLVGALRRAIPMSIAIVVLLEMLEGGTFTSERVGSAAFLGRVALVFGVFLTGGAISSFARWKSHEALYGGGAST
jgi:uncharacterized membrane protein YecN with MAPEG domain